MVEKNAEDLDTWLDEEAQQQDDFVTIEAWGF